LKQSGLPAAKPWKPDEAKAAGQSAASVAQLAERRLVTRAENVIALGLPGEGKSHFLVALGARTNPADISTRSCSCRRSSLSTTVGANEI